MLWSHSLQKNYIRYFSMVRPIKRGRGRPPKNPDHSQNPPEFFKVYLPEHNSKQLVIPPPFIKNFKGKTPTKVVLKNLQGKVWNVVLEKAEGKLLVKKGWEKFVTDNSLERGEFLIFTYKGNAVFVVKIFSINGCVKDGIRTTTNDQPLVMVKQQSNVDQTFNDQVFSNQKTQKTYLTGSMKIEQLSLDFGDVITKDVPERAILSKNIRFTKIYDERRLYEMHIPTRVLTENNIIPPKVKTSQMILLRNQRGVSQAVRIRQRLDRVVLTSGWREFQLKNKFATGDECEFEIILDKKRQIKEILLLENRPRKMIARKGHTGLRPRHGYKVG